MKNYLFICIVIFLFQLEGSAQLHESLFVGENPPGISAKKFQIGSYFDDEDNRKRSFNFAFSPDGTELFFSFVVSRSETEGTLYEIRTSKYINRKWTDPKTANFSGVYWDVDINFSPDGKYLFFASERPVGDSIQQGIFYMVKNDKKWNGPFFTGNKVSSIYGEVWPSMSDKDNLFFRSSRPGGYGADDLYRADWIDGEFINVRNLGPNVNTEYGESNSTIAPDESYILFCSSRPEYENVQKIFISFQIGDNVWSKAELLGPKVNLTRAGGPMFSADGKFLFFSTPDGHYWISTSYIDKMKPEARYMYQIPADTVPKLFAPGKVSLPNSIEFSPAFTPDGNEFYFTRFSPMENKAGIMVMKKKNGVWSDPELANFSGTYRDGEPFISHDGKRLYFSSNRPLIENGDIESRNIWYVERNEHGWSEPVYMDFPINSNNKEGHPSVSKNGTIYFHVISDNDYDIYRSKLVNGEYQAREKLSDAINTIDYIEGEPAIAPDESYLLFISAGRNDRVAKDDNTCDLYISFKKNDDTWTQANCLGPQILSEREENWPFISHDGKYIYFSSNRNTDNYFPNIYWVDAKIINKNTIK